MIFSIHPEEAYKKVCCNDLFNNCKGPACMAWRWQLGETDIKTTDDPEKHIGYCGLVD